jgi:hypothetical protein
VLPYGEEAGVSDVDRYEDGTTSWSFTGRNGFYADLDLSSTR